MSENINEKINEATLVQQEYVGRKCTNLGCRSKDTKRSYTLIAWDYHLVTWRCNKCHHKWNVGALHPEPINPKRVVTFPDEELVFNLGNQLNL